MRSSKEEAKIVARIRTTEIVPCRKFRISWMYRFCAVYAGGRQYCSCTSCDLLRTWNI